MQEVVLFSPKSECSFSGNVHVAVLKGWDALLSCQQGEQ